MMLKISFRGKLCALGKAKEFHRKRSWALIILLLSHVSLFAQTVAGPGLRVGEKVPDVVVGNIINYKYKTARLSDFKGKLLILDFWATWCSGCIRAMPKMEALEQQFNGRLQVLGVDDETEGRV